MIEDYIWFVFCLPNPLLSESVQPLHLLNYVEVEQVSVSMCDHLKSWVILLRDLAVFFF